MENVKPERRSFYKLLLTLSIPLVIQNLVDACVNLADTLMLGQYVGQTELAASALANQIQFILQLFFFGICSGSSVLIAQYWGKRDIKTIERTLGIALRFSLSLGALFAVAALVMPKTLMQIYSSETETVVEKGAEYLRYVAFGYITSAFVTVYVSTQRATERVTFGTIVNATCLIMNVILNACFIFGFWFFPEWGLKGVALATLISRICAFLMCVFDAIYKSSLKVRIKYIFARNKELMRDFIKYTLPAVGNDIMWGLGFSAYSAILGHMGEAVVAANSYAGTARSLGTVVCMAAANAAAIIMGKTMGENKLDAARAYAKKFMWIAIVTGVAGGLLIAAAIPFVSDKVNLNGDAIGYFRFMLVMSAFSVFGQSYNTMAICGIFRAGGDTKFGFIMDTSVMWGYGVLCGSLAAFVFKWPVEVVYLILFLDEYVKIPFVTVRYFKKKWVKNITHEFAD